MKKYLLLFLFISIVNSYAGPPKNKNQNAERMIGNFNNWLSKNGHTQYLEINKNDVLQLQVKSADGTNAVLSDCIFYINYLHD